MFSDNPVYAAFIEDHRWAILTTLRTSGAPVSSVVAYARDQGDLVVSTPGSTFKRSSIERDPRVNLCIISNQEPFNFVAVEGEAMVETDDLVRRTRMVFARIPDMYDEPDPLEEWLKEQGRVILRISSTRITGVIR